MKPFEKLILLAVGLVILAGGSLFCWYKWDTSANHGLSYGYYGQYNTVSNAFARLPGARILDTFYNADITLEEFGFEIETGGRSVTISFSEQDPIRRMSGTQLNKTLSARIASDLSAQAAGKP